MNLQPSFSDCSNDDLSCSYDYIGASLEYLVPNEFDSTQISEISSLLSSPETRIGKLLQVDPSISVDINILSSDSETLTVRGSGWDSIAGNNNMALWTDHTGLCRGDNAPSNTEITAYPIQGRAVQYNSTSKNILLFFDSLANRDVGTLCLFSSTSEVVPSVEDTGVPIAKIVEVIPVVNSHTSTLSSDTNKLTIFGKGFDSFELTNNDLTLTISDRTMSVIWGGSVENDNSLVAATTSISRTHMVLTFCMSLSQPAEASQKCSLALTDHGNMIISTLSWKGRTTVFTNDSTVFQANVSKVVATLPCDMRIRGNVSLRHPCSGNGTAHNIIYETVEGSDVPLVFNNQSILPYDKWSCQCECDAPDAEVVTIGEFCGDILNEQEVSCYYSCVESRVCHDVLKSWHSEYLYSPYPNTYTYDVRAMYEDMKLKTVVKDEKMTHVLRGGGIFMCMDSAVSESSQVVHLDIGDDLVSDITSFDASKSGANPRSGSFSFTIFTSTLFVVVTIIVCVV